MRQPNDPNASRGRPVVIVALLTALTREQDLDLGALREHVQHLVDEGVDGFLICGTTGEGPLLEDREIAEVTATVVGVCAGRALAVTQVGRPSTAATVRLLERAREAGADGAVVVAPYYYALEEAQVEAHYAAVLAHADGAPLYAYAIPRRTGNDLSAGLVGRLARGGLAGIKDSTRSLERHAEYRSIAKQPGLERFGVYMGSDAYVLDAFTGPSTGVVSAVANVRPDLLLRLRTAVMEGRLEDAAGLQAELEALREAVSAGSTIPRLKAAVASRMSPRGVAYSTAVRAPLGA